MKLVIRERESDAIRRLLRREPDQVASAIVEIEVVRAIRRVAPHLVPPAQRAVAQLTVVEPTGPIRSRAAGLDPVTLRSLDALHLATALELGDELDAVVTYDARMLTGAQTLGLPVLAPT